MAESAREAVLAVNGAFYDAFESRDLDAMDRVWERSPRAACTHPGWGTLRGWDRIRSSFAAIFEGSAAMQFILTDVTVAREGPVAWVTCDENLWGGDTQGTVAALNVFVHDGMDRSWRMVAHHGSPVGRG